MATPAAMPSVDTKPEDMKMNSKVSRLTDHNRDWLADVRELAGEFGKRATDYDQAGFFVAENYDDLRDAGFFSAAIPAELGGGGADFADICGVVREIGKHCGSTALSFAMHSHTVGANVFKYLHGDQSVADTLRKIADNELIISTTGANDWLQSSGNAERIDGGFRINARKHFVSGCPGADVLATSVTFEGEDGTEVLHFAIPKSSEGIEIVETWDTLGMRGTGSHDVVYANTFIPDTAVIARRPAGKWHPMWEVILPTAMPLISAAYVGLAEAATCMALDSAKRKGAYLAGVAGELLNAFTIAELSLEDMVRLNDNHGFAPGIDLVSKILTRKAIVAEQVKETVEIAAELVGGPGFYRGHAMERIVRDIRALHYHPLPLRRQQLFSGRLALGFDAIESE
jgi:acyl-CoA dehydrogenase